MKTSEESLGATQQSLGIIDLGSTESSVNEIHGSICEVDALLDIVHEIYLAIRVWSVNVRQFHSRTAVAAVEENSETRRWDHRADENFMELQKSASKTDLNAAKLTVSLSIWPRDSKSTGQMVSSNLHIILAVVHDGSTSDLPRISVSVGILDLSYVESEEDLGVITIKQRTSVTRIGQKDRISRAVARNKPLESLSKDSSVRIVNIQTGDTYRHHIGTCWFERSSTILRLISHDDHVVVC